MYFGWVHDRALPQELVVEVGGGKVSMSAVADDGEDVNSVAETFGSFRGADGIMMERDSAGGSSTATNMESSGLRRLVNYFVVVGGMFLMLFGEQ